MANDNEIRIDCDCIISVLCKDPLNRLVQPDVFFIMGYQNSDVTIPCKPTAMHFDVKLLKEGDEVRILFWFLSNSIVQAMRNCVAKSGRSLRTNE